METLLMASRVFGLKAFFFSCEKALRFAKQWILRSLALVLSLFATAACLLSRLWKKTTAATVRGGERERERADSAEGRGAEECTAGVCVSLRFLRRLVVHGFLHPLAFRVIRDCGLLGRSLRAGGELRPRTSLHSSSIEVERGGRDPPPALPASAFALAKIRRSLALLAVSALARLADLFDFKTRKRCPGKGFVVGGGDGVGPGTMLWLVRLSGLCSAAMFVIVLSPTLQSSPPAEAIRSGHYLGVPGDGRHHRRVADVDGSGFRRAQTFRNAAECEPSSLNGTSPCDPYLVHIAITLDKEYLRGSIAAVHSVLGRAQCPENFFFHFLVSERGLEPVVQSAFPGLRFKTYHFDPERVRGLISSSVRQALEQPLNYARNYLAELLEPCVKRVIYLDSDLVVVDDVAKLWRTELGSRAVGAPEYCHANFTKYFTGRFWSDQSLASTFSGRRPCYFNTGVMVLDLNRWRRSRYTRRIERWMEVQKSGEAPGGAGRIYELGSLPPFLLVFAGHVAPIEHRWNQHGLGGDNVIGSCRDLHPGPVSLLHWSGSGKPWVRLDSNRPCPLDHLWAPYDLYGPAVA